jgi:ankyrin repeat protein
MNEPHAPVADTKSKESAKGLIVVRDMPRAVPEKNAQDKAIEQLVNLRAWEGDTIAFSSKLATLRDEGGSFDRVTVLHVLAANKDPLAVFESVVSLGANVNYVDPRTGCCPLHLAATAEHEEVVRFLLQKGANKTVENMDGRAPLQLMNHSACSMSDFMLTFGLPGEDNAGQTQQRLRHLLS